MNVRPWLLPVAVINTFAAIGIYVATSIAAPIDAPMPLPPAMIVAAPAPKPAHTTLDPIDPATLRVGCPPLSHAPWRGWLNAPLNPDERDESDWLLIGDEPLVLTNGPRDRRGRPVLPGAYSVMALSAPPSEQATLRSVLPRRFQWIQHQDTAGVYYTEQPGADGKDAVVRLDPISLQETGRWTLPAVPIPVHGGAFQSISIAGRTGDGRLAAESRIAVNGDPRAGIEATANSGLCLIDTSKTTDAVSCMLVTQFAGGSGMYPTGPTEFLGYYNAGGHPGRALTDWSTGRVTPVAATDPRFAGYLEMPPRLLSDHNFQVALGVSHSGKEEALVTGTGAVRLGFPTAIRPTTLNQSPGDGEFVAGAVRAVVPPATRFSLTPLTRDLAVRTSLQLKRLPITIEALNGDYTLMVQVVTPEPTAQDSQVQAGCLRLGKLDVVNGTETWIGTIPLPPLFVQTPYEPAIKCARLDDSLIITWRSSSKSQYEQSHNATPTPGPKRHAQAWTRVAWPAAFPDDVPDGWLGNISPRPGTLIP